MKPAKKIYFRDFGISMALYVIAIIGGSLYLEGSGDTLSIPLASMVALLPILPILLAIRAVIIFSHSWDELQKRQAFEGMLIAFFIVGMGTFSYGLLEGIGYPKLDTVFVFPLLVGLQGLGQIIAARRYK